MPSTSWCAVCGMKYIKIDRSPLEWDVGPESISHLFGLFSFNVAVSASIATAADFSLSSNLALYLGQRCRAAAVGVLFLLRHALRFFTTRGLILLIIFARII